MIREHSLPVIAFRWISEGLYRSWVMQLSSYAVVLTLPINSKRQLLRPLLGLSKSGLICGMVLILNIEDGYRPKCLDIFFHTFFFA